MERALLEGEHQMEMDELEREQQTINRLKHRQLELIDQATAEREKVRKNMIQTRKIYFSGTIDHLYILLFFVHFTLLALLFFSFDLVFFFIWFVSLFTLFNCFFA